MLDEVVKNFKKEIGPISSDLIDKDPEYREMIVKEAIRELSLMVAKRIKVDPVFTEHDPGVVPRKDLPCFTKGLKFKILTFKMVVD